MRIEREIIEQRPTLESRARAMGFTPGDDGFPYAVLVAMRDPRLGCEVGRALFRPVLHGAMARERADELWGAARYIHDTIGRYRAAIGIPKGR